MREQLRGLLRHRLVQNILALSGFQSASYLFPLMTLPYLTRVLGPTDWGLLAFAWSFGGYVILLVEFGFNLSATREVSLYRNDLNRLADLLAGVLGSKMLLAACVIGSTLLVQRWVPSFQEHPALLWSSVFWALAHAFSPIWYYHGLERMRLVGTLDILAKALATAGIFLLVSSPNDGWKVLTLQGLASFGSTVVALALAYREVPFRFPSWSLVWEALQAGWTMFISRSAVSLYTVGNAFILGLFAPPQVVGYYAGAEKISTAFLGLLRPVNQALYPRLSYLADHARVEAARLARLVTVLMSIGGVLMGSLIFLLAPLLVRTMLGEQFDPAVSVLRVLALLLPLVVLSNALGLNWMLPLRLEPLFNRIILGAGLLNLVLALVLATRYAHLGMAWAVVAAELFVTVSIYTVLHWRGLNPLNYSGEAIRSKGK